MLSRKKKDAFEGRITSIYEDDRNGWLQRYHPDTSMHCFHHSFFLWSLTKAHNDERKLIELLMHYDDDLQLKSGP